MSQDYTYTGIGFRVALWHCYCMQAASAAATKMQQQGGAGQGWAGHGSYCAKLNGMAKAKSGPGGRCRPYVTKPDCGPVCTSEV
mmetsp:Transcript_35401/g.92634  ORF Transcript_35401/g.92634 Transcript_35401/m.92634 type:complete len:84 (-) Transcript_35401:1104-1355(-)